MADIEQESLFKIYHHFYININAEILLKEGIHIGTFDTGSVSLVGYVMYTFLNGENIYQRIMDQKGMYKMSRAYLWGQWSGWS